MQSLFFTNRGQDPAHRRIDPPALGLGPLPEPLPEPLHGENDAPAQVDVGQLGEHAADVALAHSEDLRRLPHREGETVGQGEGRLAHRSSPKAARYREARASARSSRLQARRRRFEARPVEQPGATRSVVGGNPAARREGVMPW